MDILASIIKVTNKVTLSTSFHIVASSNNCEIKNDCCGSSVINILFEKIQIYSGDQKIQELIVYLAQTVTKQLLCLKA